jgi:hypothetical protein
MLLGIRRSQVHHPQRRRSACAHEPRDQNGRKYGERDVQALQIVKAAADAGARGLLGTRASATRMGRG